MGLSTFLEIVIAIIGAFIIFLLASWIGNNIKKDSQSGCSIGLIGGIIIFVLLKITSIKIIEVYSTNGKLDYKERDYWGGYELELPNGEKRNLSTGYGFIVNKSDEILILYPQFYGNAYSNIYYERAIAIAPSSFAPIEDVPNYYFEPAPSRVGSKRDSETKWVLDSYKNLSNREGFDLNDLNLDLEEINNLQNSSK